MNPNSAQAPMLTIAWSDQIMKGKPPLPMISLTGATTIYRQLIGFWPATIGACALLLAPCCCALLLVLIREAWAQLPVSAIVLPGLGALAAIIAGALRASSAGDCRMEADALEAERAARYSAIPPGEEA